MEDFDVHAMIEETVSGAMEAVEAAQQTVTAVQDVHTVEITDADIDALIAENSFGSTPGSVDTDVVNSLMEGIGNNTPPTPTPSDPPAPTDTPIDLEENGEGSEEELENAPEALATEIVHGTLELDTPVRNEDPLEQYASRLIAIARETFERYSTDTAISTLIDHIDNATSPNEKVEALRTLRTLLTRDYHLDLPPIPTIAEPLPQNSPTLLVDETTTRFSGAEWFKEIQKAKIIVAGIGGIGTNCVFQLARMKPARLVMYDDDRVEMLNMAGQLYSMDDIGLTKVAAMNGMIRKYTNMENIYAINEKFTSTSEAGDIMMCGFDNMKARKIFYQAWEKHVLSLPEGQRSKCLFLDGRLSMDTIQILAVTGDDRANQNRYWNEFLFSDMEAEETVCSMKQTTYLACMIGSLMVNIFTNFIANTINPIIPYDVPFYLEYDAQNMIFRTEK